MSIAIAQLLHRHKPKARGDATVFRERDLAWSVDSAQSRALPSCVHCVSHRQLGCRIARVGPHSPLL